MNATIENKQKQDPVGELLNKSMQSVGLAILGIIRDTAVMPILRKRSKTK